MRTPFLNGDLPLLSNKSFITSISPASLMEPKGKECPASITAAIGPDDTNAAIPPAKVFRQLDSRKCNSKFN